MEPSSFGQVSFYMADMRLVSNSNGFKDIEKRKSRYGKKGAEVGGRLRLAESINN
ncbi:hypothetical protein TUM12370_17290 [Salmonella enterica subsp. enterica serovar Choleraesuis]|nr:hypothetical protein TUM12370_17290 [Salmonella enterica subsp. enterica serovar Choleraesuis]